MLGQPQPLGLRLQLGLMRAAAGDQEAHVLDLLDHAGQRVERQLEALLVDQPPDQQHELLVRRRELAPQRLQVSYGSQFVRVDPVGDHRYPPLVDVEDVGHVPAHVVGADDHRVRAASHPALDGVDVRLRGILHPALVAPVLGRVDRRHVWHAQPVGERRGGVRDEPVMAVDEVVGVLLGQRLAGREHVLVHLLHPGDEAIEVARPARLAHAMHPHAGELRQAGLTRLWWIADPAREHVHARPLADERLGELAHVPGQPALDHGRVLPGEEQHAIAHAPYLARPRPYPAPRALLPSDQASLRSLISRAHPSVGPRARPTPPPRRGTGPLRASSAVSRPAHRDASSRDHSARDHRAATAGQSPVRVLSRRRLEAHSILCAWEPFLLVPGPAASTRAGSPDFQWIGEYTQLGTV